MDNFLSENDCSVFGTGPQEGIGNKCGSAHIIQEHIVTHAGNQVVKKREFLDLSQNISLEKIRGSMLCFR